MATQPKTPYTQNALILTMEKDILKQLEEASELILLNEGGLVPELSTEPKTEQNSTQEKIDQLLAQ